VRRVWASPRLTALWHRGLLGRPVQPVQAVVGALRLDLAKQEPQVILMRWMLVGPPVPVAQARAPVRQLEPGWVEVEPRQAQALQA
jgi:hypothetical protein